ncbi:MAG: cobyric acid synthase [Rhodospirillaceae bacterium]|jgi:adenosylcobyric acid synthase|nr:cobyric acid synthase [Rhodospirillaceae bacterium]MBT5810506.1 cobyric acid synthase [Rhodospirillaceae bacterium]
MSRTPTLMLQGTGSDVGKSLLVAGLCRAATARGLRVRPFKPQNMSNNAATASDAGPDGGEIGRAQALQARACGVAPSIHMNPILLKPQSEIGAQVIVQGTVAGNATARDYHDLKTTLMPKVLDSFTRLSADADLILVEGAGSPAEVNLRDGDIANMGFAEAADIPVVLAADINRGGVIASLVGTHALLRDSERARIAGYIINKFRGDKTLFDPALSIIESHTGIPCLGVAPWFEDARHLPAEDAMALDSYTERNDDENPIRIAVPRLGRMANFDDLDPLRAENGVAVSIIQPGDVIPANTDIVLLPGSKSTRADLQALRDQGWDHDIHAHVRRGGIVVGLCGGYQMLGVRIADPHGVEGTPGETLGLGLLDIETTIGAAKTLRDITVRDPATGAAAQGYEMHMGDTTGPATARPMLDAPNNHDRGATSPNGQVMGCYVHGLFAADAYRAAFLNRVRSGQYGRMAYESRIEITLDRLAAHLEENLEVDRLLDISGL